jgi:hypothetical protein
MADLPTAPPDYTGECLIELSEAEVQARRFVGTGRLLCQHGLVTDDPAKAKRWGNAYARYYASSGNARAVVPSEGM